MNYRKFGNTNLSVSEIGFGAWGIGGPAMAGDVPIGWGNVDEDASISALRKSSELGINFYDTADFYGLGHSEELIGNVFGNSDKVIIATKVGHRMAEDQSIFLDYSKKYILQACEGSLKRLKRDSIDYYQLHSAKLTHLKAGECIEAMELLKQQGKIRYWGLSLNTFNPNPEAYYLIKNKLADGFQLVLNIINQRANNLVETAGNNGYGIIARMPLQFGLLTGKFSASTQFKKNDHRYFRLTPEVLNRSLDALKKVKPIADKYQIPDASFALSFLTTYANLSTIIPGIKTPKQAEANTKDIIKLDKQDFTTIKNMFETDFKEIVNLFESCG